MPAFDRFRPTLIAALRAAYHPATFIGLLILLGGIASLRAVPARQSVTRVTVSIETPTVADDPTEEVQLVLIGDGGVERTRFVALPAASDSASQLNRLTAALREVMLAEGTWPAELPAPQVFLVERGSVKLAVLNFTLTRQPNVTIAQEQQLYASLAATLQRHGVGEMRILINGHPSPVFLNHLALRRSLE